MDPYKFMFECRDKVSLGVGVGGGDGVVEVWPGLVWIVEGGMKILRRGQR